LPQARRYLTPQLSPLLFIPNDQKHIFEEEKLTPQQNRDAIPPKPSFDHLTNKKHHHVIDPADMSDLVLKLNSNDLIVTMLSKQKILFGDESYVIDGTGRPTRFEYGRILCSWAEAFNKTIQELRDLPHQEFIRYSAPEELVKLYMECDSDFEKFFEETQAVNNSKKKREGLILTHGSADLITMDKASLLVLSQLSTSEEIAKFTDFMNKNIQHFSIRGLIDNLTMLTDISYRLRGDISYAFVTSINDRFPTILKSLPLETIDKLAYLLASKNWEFSRTLLQLILKKNVCPSADSVNQFLLNFVNSDPETKLKELSFLKLVLYCRGVSELPLQILLSTIRNVHEFNKLVNLIKMANDGKTVLEKYQNILFMTLKRVSTNFPLHLAGFVRFLTEEEVPVDIQAVKKLQSEQSKK
jgi:hypothetical protein